MSVAIAATKQHAPFFKAAETQECNGQVKSLDEQKKELLQQLAAAKAEAASFKNDYEAAKQQISQLVIVALYFHERFFRFGSFLCLWFVVVFFWI